VSLYSHGLGIGPIAPKRCDSRHKIPLFSLASSAIFNVGIGPGGFIGGNLLLQSYWKRWAGINWRLGQYVIIDN
jgi:hypothetical protein